MNTEQISELFFNHMDNIYACTRVWSAWSYGTMSIDDFIPFSEEDDIINDFKQFINNKQSVNANELEQFFDQYEGFFNANIEDNFDNVFFDDDFLGHCDLEEMAQDVNKLKQESKPKSRIRP